MSEGFVHVVAAALVDGCGRVLIQRRPARKHLAGLWEFPGGKLEPGEDRARGLARELHEELGIRTESALPLICVRHDYGDKRVLLDVWRVRRWTGEPHGREGQPVRWVPPGALDGYAFPAADRPVLKALSLPSTCLVTPPPGADRQQWLEDLVSSLRAGIDLVVLRAPGLEGTRMLALCQEVVARCREVAPGARVVLNGAPGMVAPAGAHGVHLDSRRLWQVRGRPVPVDLLAGASCHDAADLARAAALDLDFAFLGPVSATATHPGAVPLGWNAFESMALAALLPVYALGGLSARDLATAQQRGGQGIAAIRGLWSGPAGVSAARE